MIRIILFTFLVVSMFLPAAHAEEEFEFIHCYFGKIKPMHESKDLTPIMTYTGNGIIMSKSENNFLDNASTHCKGFMIGKIPSPTMKFINYCVAIDPDGDMLIWGSPETGGVAGQNFLNGTGKYKGIKGNFKSQLTASAKKPLKPGTYQQCRTMKGTYELPLE